MNTHDFITDDGKFLIPKTLLIDIQFQLRLYVTKEARKGYEGFSSFLKEYFAQDLAKENPELFQICILNNIGISAATIERAIKGGKGKKKTEIKYELLDFLCFVCQKTTLINCLLKERYIGETLYSIDVPEYAKEQLKNPIADIQYKNERQHDIPAPLIDVDENVNILDKNVETNEDVLREDIIHSFTLKNLRGCDIETIQHPLDIPNTDVNKELLELFIEYYSIHESIVSSTSDTKSFLIDRYVEEENLVKEKINEELTFVLIDSRYIPFLNNSYPPFSEIFYSEYLKYIFLENELRKKIYTIHSDKNEREQLRTAIRMQIKKLKIVATNDDIFTLCSSKTSERNIFYMYGKDSLAYSIYNSNKKIIHLFEGKILEKHFSAQRYYKQFLFLRISNEHNFISKNQYELQLQKLNNDFATTTNYLEKYAFRKDVKKWVRNGTQSFFDYIREEAIEKWQSALKKIKSFTTTGGI